MDSLKHMRDEGLPRMLVLFHRQAIPKVCRLQSRIVISDIQSLLIYRQATPCEALFRRNLAYRPNAVEGYIEIDTSLLEGYKTAIFGVAGVH